MIQYNVDIKSAYSQQFKTIRKILLSHAAIKELKNAKQTYYSDQYGVIIMMKTKGDTLVVAFGKGHKLQERYPQLQDDGKIVRHLYYKENDKVDEALLRKLIDERLVLGMEAYEMKLMRCNSMRGVGVLKKPIV